MTLIRSLLIGIICLGSLATKTKAEGASWRPDEVPISILREGCHPFSGYQCPPKMECYIDLSYPKYGQCLCRPDFYFTRKQPENTGLELAPLPHKDDCIIMGPVNVLAFFHYIIPTIVYFYMIVVGCSMMRAIYRGGGLKWNSSCVALVLCILANIGGCGRSVFYGYTRMNWDKNWIVFDRTYLITDFMESSFTPWMTFECSCTWFDLWQKSVTMSKKSNSIITVIRSFLRFYALVVALISVMGTITIIPGLTFMVLGPYVNTLNQGMLIFTCGILSPLIARVLCKNMKEVTNPNWKAASAIRNSGLTGVLVPFFFNIQFRFLLWSGLWTNQAIQLNHTSIFSLVGLHMTLMFVWFQYLQFAHRRYLKDSHTSRISEYFGLTTIGLNGSSRESSFLSGKSSTTTSSAASGASTTSSVGGASSASTAEGETAADGKGTMA